MAGDWIKMRGNLWDDPRVTAIVDATDSSEAAVVGALYWLWATADQHTEDGVMHGLTLRAIDRKTGVAGFGQALCSVGWLEECIDGVRIVAFSEHNGESAKKRCQTAKRVANHKAANAQVTQAALPTEHESVSSALPREREEKRREEIKETEPNGSDGKAVADLTKAELWAAGKSLLQSQGTPAAQCGSFVGKLVKDYGEAVVIDAVRAAVVERPADAASFLVGACKSRGKRRRSEEDLASQSAASTAEAARILGIHEQEVIDA